MKRLIQSILTLWWEAAQRREAEWKLMETDAHVRWARALQDADND